MDERKIEIYNREENILDSKIVKGIGKWFRKDWFIILVCILTIMIHLWMGSTDYQLITQCNNHWQEQWNDICNVPVEPQEYNGGITWQEINSLNNNSDT